MTPQSIQAWLRAINQQPGYEILLVQTVRNALMGASVVASTSLVAIIGVITVARAFPSGAPGLHYAHWVIDAASVVLAFALTESLLALRTLSRAGFGSVAGASSDTGPDDPERYSRELAGALRQLARAAVGLSVGMALAVLGGIMFAW
jgi:hypothetical protein